MTEALVYIKTYFVFYVNGSCIVKLKLTHPSIDDFTFFIHIHKWFAIWINQDKVDCSMISSIEEAISLADGQVNLGTANLEDDVESRAWNEGPHKSS